MDGGAGGASRLTLIDGSGFIFRAFHALPPMTNPEGVPINAVFGFVTMLMKLREANGTSLMVVVFDSGRITFRNEIYPDYKANRPEPPEELVPQFALIRDAVRAFNIACVELPGFEADDLIASYAKAAVARGLTVSIVSSDKDLMQLVRDGVSMQDPLKNKPIGPAEVREKFGVDPDKVVEVQALAGDPTDNVPGVPGIGIKTAAQLIGEYGDVETLLARAGEIRQPKRRQTLLDNAEAARISRRLVALCDEVPLPEPIDAFAIKAPDPLVLAGFLDKHGMRSVKARLQALLAQGAAPAAAPSLAADGAPPAVEAPEAAPETLDYELVLSEAVLARWVEEARAAGIVAIDTETDGLDAMRADLVGISLATIPGRACYIPVRHTPEMADLLDAGSRDAGPVLIPKDRTLALLAPLLGDDAVLKVGHNIKYDLHILASQGLDQIAPIEDTMVLSAVLDGSRHGHGMDELAELHLGHKTISFAEVCGTGRNRITFDKVPLDRALAYAAEDADITLRLYRLLKPRLLAEHLVFVHERLDRPLIGVLAGMERQGIKVDRAELVAMSAEFAGRMAAMEAEIHDLAKGDFNVASPKQLGEVLFERLGLPGGKRTKTGAYATGSEVLDQLAPLHPLPARVLDWRQIAKLKSTYADALVSQIHPRTGRIHTSFSMTAANTGRLASSDPNLQNIPIRTEEGRRIRRAFIAEEGALLLSADYSQIELRLVAHVAGIKGLIEAFSGDADIHAITASQVFGVPVEGMDPMLRRRAKAINFGIIYGISAFGLAQQLGIANGEAKAYIDAYFARYPEIRRYMEETKVSARQRGHVTTFMGRRIQITGLADRNPSVRGFAERAAINAPIQGGAADIIKRAMIRLPGALEAAGLKARMLLQVHDELVFEVEKAEADATARVVRDIMEGAASLAVPLKVEIGRAANWADAH